MELNPIIQKVINFSTYCFCGEQIYKIITYKTKDEEIKFEAFCKEHTTITEMHCITCNKSATGDFNIYDELFKNIFQEFIFCSNMCCRNYYHILKKFKEEKHGKENISFKCSICDKPASLRCSRCRLRRYCNEECQKKDWKEHKILCTKN